MTLEESRFGQGAWATIVSISMAMLLVDMAVALFRVSVASFESQMEQALAEEPHTRQSAECDHRSS